MGRWPWQKDEEDDPVDDDPRLSQTECESLWSLTLAAQAAWEMGETDLQAKLLKEIDLVIRRGFSPPSIASVRSLGEVRVELSPELKGK